MTTNTDWIEWAGGECPVPGDTRVEVRYRDLITEELEASVVSEREYGNNWWKHEGASYSKPVYGTHHADIIAYRIVKP